MQPIPIILIVFGIILILIGLIYLAIINFTSLSEIPGDITFKTKNTTIYFPIATSIILSIILSILLTIIFRFLSK